MRKRQTSSHLERYLHNEPLLPLLTIEDVAKLLKISRPTVYMLIDEGLPCIRFGRAVRISSVSLQTFLARYEVVA